MEIKTTIEVSKKQIEIVQYLSNGLRVKEVANEMKEKQKTMEVTISRMMIKFDAKTQSELVSIFFRNKLIQ